MTEDLLAQLADLQAAAQPGPEDVSPGLVTTGAACGLGEAPSPGGDGDSPLPQAPAPGATDSCVAVHVLSAEEEDQQQQLDLLWRELDERAPPVQVGGDELRRDRLVKGPPQVPSWSGRV